MSDLIRGMMVAILKIVTSPSPSECCPEVPVVFLLFPSRFRHVFCTFDEYHVVTVDSKRKCIVCQTKASFHKYHNHAENPPNGTNRTPKNRFLFALLR
ncbi:MAG: hypothetical protein ACPGWR_32040, partial [Ardenticatenaceae bacterium]